MAERSVFLYAAVYDSPDDARADYELLLDAHAEGSAPPARAPSGDAPL